MKYQELIILLPCHSLEDFPLHHRGHEAEGLLAAWTALWHPALIAAASGIVTFHRVDAPPDRVAERLVVVPEVSEPELPTGFVQRAAEEKALLIKGGPEREAIVAEALAHLDGGPGAVEPGLVAEFFAVGYCYLQVELLTRQMRYSSNLDQVHFTNQMVAGAQAAMAGDVEQARQRIARCFDVLAQERDHYYPVDAFILDIVLMAETTLGTDLQTQLQSGRPLNLLISAELVERLQQEHPQSLAVLREAVEQKRVAIIGGELHERRLALVGCETVLRELERGLRTYETLLGQRPVVWGRRRFGATTLLPQLLRKLGFQAALHAGLEEGRMPEGSQIKIRWEGNDGSTIDALARPPLDAGQPENYLSFAMKIGDSMEHDHVATVCLAHWPARSSRWMRELQVIARYNAVLGKFITVDDYFRESDLPAHLDRFEPDQYRTPYLKQAVAAKEVDPISSCVRYWQRRLAAEAEQTLGLLQALVTNRAEAVDAASVDNPILDEADATIARADEPEGLGERLSSRLQSAAQRLAEVMPRQSARAETGYLCFNPHSFVARAGIDVSHLPGLPATERPVYAAADHGGQKQAVVDVPPLGFSWISAGGDGQRPKGSSPPLAENNVLRNEFFEAIINTTTGALQSIHEYGSRGNRLSQQVAYRFSPNELPRGVESNEDALYSIMAADEVKTTVASDVRGEIVARGRLLNREGEKIAGFQQTYRLWRGSRVILIDVELDPLVEPRSDAWNSYYCCRFAWSQEAADLWRSVHQQRQRVVSAKRFEAPLFVDIESGEDHTTILTGGLPYHRRSGLRMLDSLLLVRGERCRRFQLGIGIDLKQPLQEAIKLLSPPIALPQSAAPPDPVRSAWLFHIDARNVISTWWSPIAEHGHLQGFRVRLLEVAGRPARLKLSCFRPLAEARQVDFLGHPLGDAAVEDGHVRLELSANEWTEVEARFHAGG